MRRLSVKLFMIYIISLRETTYTDDPTDEAKRYHKLPMSDEPSAFLSNYCKSPQLPIIPHRTAEAVAAKNQAPESEVAQPTFFTEGSVELSPSKGQSTARSRKDSWQEPDLPEAPGVQPLPTSPPQHGKQPRGAGPPKECSHPPTSRTRQARQNVVSFALTQLMF